MPPQYYQNSEKVTSKRELRLDCVSDRILECSPLLFHHLDFSPKSDFVNTARITSGSPPVCGQPTYALTPAPGRCIPWVMQSHFANGAVCNQLIQTPFPTAQSSPIGRHKTDTTPPRLLIGWHTCPRFLSFIPIGCELLTLYLCSLLCCRAKQCKLKKKIKYVAVLTSPTD